MEIFYQLKTCEREETLLWEGEPVLTLRCRRPELSALEPAAERRINCCFRRAETLFLRRCRTRLYRRAGAELAEKRAASRPFTPWEAELSFENEETDGLLRIALRYTLRRGELAPQTARTAELWDLSSGFPVSNRR